MTRLFTVPIEKVTAQFSDSTKGRGFSTRTFYECDFAGIRFSRRNEAVLKFWVRIAARHVYGNDTQVIFVHEEGKQHGPQRITSHRIHEGRTTTA